MARETFNEFNQSALEEVLSFLGETFTLNGTAYTGVVNRAELSLSFEPEIPGQAAEESITVIALRTDFLTAPAVGEVLAYDGRNYRVSEVTRDPVSYELSCKTATR